LSLPLSYIQNVAITDDVQG